jgi:release factor glutamine methyltransferase
VALRHGLWYGPVAGERFDLVLANPPYVREGDPHLADGDVRFEPRSALVAGPDGLESIREIVREAPAHLVRGGRILLEHGLGQDAQVRQLLERAGLEDARSWPDLAGIARVSGARLE